MESIYYKESEKTPDEDRFYLIYYINFKGFTKYNIEINKSLYKNLSNMREYEFWEYYNSLIKKI
jgi:hypothetical protein